MNKNTPPAGMRQIRSLPAEFQTRDDGGNLSIEGYFAVFNSIYEIASDMSESIAPGAFSSSLSGDIRALINHDTTLVLGRTKAHTLQLREDERGLWGHIDINPNDGDAMNLYERVKRGDVDQCSFGFDILREDTEVRQDGSVHWTIRDVILYEVSCCTFPAYEQTNISARSKERDDLRERSAQAWREKMKERLKNGTQSSDAS
ncbi:MAG: HK97 family phage prohead protease [Clostridia bacterium]|nr:HK97 family phage prohead protease [Clostridia bacterium]